MKDFDDYYFVFLNPEYVWEQTIEPSFIAHHIKCRAYLKVSYSSVDTLLNKLNKDNK